MVFKWNGVQMKWCSKQDVTCNKLVSIFLHKLEYYKDISYYIALEDSIRTTRLYGKHWEFLVYMHYIAFSCGLENQNLLKNLFRSVLVIYKKSGSSLIDFHESVISCPRILVKNRV
jgi:hypothetical protein